MRHLTFFSAAAFIAIASFLLSACNQDKKKDSNTDDSSTILSGIVDSFDGDKALETDENGKPLTQAADFEYTGLDGSSITLSEIIKEKEYIVLDFWGTWCKWCIKGIPEMKKYYKKYNTRVEFISIACYDDEAQVRKLVLAEEMDWKHILNDENTPEKDLTQSYNIQGFPTKVIINSKGNIVASYEGESNDFYEKLDELLK